MSSAQRSAVTFFLLMPVLGCRCVRGPVWSVWEVWVGDLRTDGRGWGLGC